MVALIVWFSFLAVLPMLAGGLLELAGGIIRFDGRRRSGIEAPDFDGAS